MDSGLSQEVVSNLEKEFHALTESIEHHLREKIRDSGYKENYRSWLEDQFLQLDEETMILGSRQLTYFLIDVLLYIPINKVLDDDPDFSLILKTLHENFASRFTNRFFKSLFSDKTVLRQLNSCWKVINSSKQSDLGVSLLETYYEKLLPAKIKRRWGQVYTAPEIAQLLAEWCIQSPSDQVMDPAFGTGRILHAIYNRLSYLSGHTQISEEDHKTILSQIYGCERNKITAQIARFSLGCQKNCNNLIQQDFFEYCSPIQLDTVLMNPPYTKHEHLNFEIQGQNYKQFVRSISLSPYEKDRSFQMNSRIGFYAYFLIHATRYLTNTGFLGFIVPNAWLDVDYGRDIQKFLFDYYKIIAVIEPESERFFPDADVNACICIIQRCTDLQNRNNNVIKFVRLRKPLKTYKSQNNLQKLISLIRETNQFYLSDRIQIFPKIQKELFEEGKVGNKYPGSKWGKYIRAPPIFFKIINQNQRFLAPLKTFATVRYPIKTGANEFFYLGAEKVKKWKIEPEYLKKVLKSPREIKQIIIDPATLSLYVLLVHKPKSHLQGTNVLKYIEWGENTQIEIKRGVKKGKFVRGYHQLKTTSGRNPWYNVGEFELADIFFPRFFHERYVFIVNTDVIEDQTFYGVLFHKNYQKYLQFFAAVLNSTIGWFFAELLGRVSLGGGALQYAVYEAQDTLVLHPEKISIDLREEILEAFKVLTRRTVLSIYEELGAGKWEELALGKIKSDRRKLDELILGKILNLSETEQLDFYQSVLKLLTSRLTKAHRKRK
ncbi:MAG: class I SAM-dependent DNA methyltransferase [Candidatus Hermodarchaeota archaeon]